RGSNREERREQLGYRSANATCGGDAEGAEPARADAFSPARSARARGHVAIPGLAAVPVRKGAVVGRHRGVVAVRYHVREEGPRADQAESDPEGRTDPTYALRLRGRIGVQPEGRA